MSVPQRFNDSEYKNWLKCAAASIVLKENLHRFVDTGVYELHKDIKQNVFSFLSGSNGTTQCNSCSSSMISHKRATGRNPARWMINCPNNICDVWLDEILAVHNEPDNKSISWKNSDITKWETDRYEIAKIFMPRGLDKKTNLPEELDFPAVLSLLKYCKCFSKSVPNTQLLTDLIGVRNTLYHSGSFKVRDADRDKWIDMMLQLVIDLYLQGTVYTDLSMLKMEEISINFQEIETKALMNSMTLLRCDIEVVQNEMVGLQETQIRLSMQIQKSEEDTSMKTETLEKDMKEVKRHLIELTQVSDKMAIFIENNDVKDKDILYGVGCNEKNIIELRSRQCEVEKKILDIKSEVSSVKEQMGRNKEETTQQLEQLERTIGENEQEVKSCKSVGRKIWCVVRIILSLILLTVSGTSAGVDLHTCLMTLKPLLGNGINWLVALMINSVILAIYSCALTIRRPNISITGNRRKSTAFQKRWIQYGPELFGFLLVVVPVVCFFHTEKYMPDEGRTFLMEKINRTYGDVLPASELFSEVFDKLQIENQCCGIKHYTDFHSATQWNRTSISTNETMIIPPSCCKLKNSDQETPELRSETCTVDGSESNKDKPCWDDIQRQYNKVVKAMLLINIFQLIGYGIIAFGVPIYDITVYHDYECAMVQKMRRYAYVEVL